MRAQTIRLARRAPTEVYVISCDVLASMKSKDYTVYIVVDQQGQYIRAPFSRCTCPAGNLFCAHMLGLMVVGYILQLNKDWTIEDLKEKMPVHVLKLQRQIIPIKCLYH